jgi:endogenous inhibitor of DNA gyrase (YacG/DUF329 family)
MSSWTLRCATCKVEFTHTEITRTDSLFDPFVRSSPKPEFPAGGLTLNCPNCGAPCVYEQFQPVYQVP